MNFKLLFLPVIKISKLFIFTPLHLASMHVSKKDNKKRDAKKTQFKINKWLSQSWTPKRSTVCLWEPGLTSLAWPQSWPGLRLASTQILAWPQKLAWPQIWPLNFFWPHFFVFRIIIYWSWFNWYIISILHLYITIFVFVLLASMLLNF